MKTKLYTAFITFIFFSNYKSSAQTNKNLSNLTAPTAVNQTLLPNANSTKDLGSSTLGWRDIYISDRLFLNGNLSLQAPGISNFFAGSSAGNSALTGTYNTGSGNNALHALTTGSHNTANGAYSLYSNREGHDNTANGSEALRFNSTGNYNTANGSDALHYNTTGSYNTSTGYYSLYANTTGRDNTANGYYTLRSNTTGYFNTATGSWSLYNNLTGVNNTAAGYSALYLNTTGNSNTAIGTLAMYNNSTGNSNAALGKGALYSNTTGSVNTATGEYALYSNNVGSANTAVGNSALTYNTAGFYNAAYGNSALKYNVIGSFNTAVGMEALYAAQGSYNTAIGFSADINGTEPYIGNTTAIGFDATVQQSNQVRLGNTSITSIGGQVGWTTFSDGRYKKNIKENVPGLAFINKLRPILYNVDIKSLKAYINKGNKQIAKTITEAGKVIEEKATEESAKIIYDGFVAQEVEKAAKELGFEFSGVDKPTTKDGLYGLRYDNFVVPLVKAVQELSKENEALKDENKALERRIEKLEVLMNTSSSNLSPALKNIRLPGASLEQNAPTPFSNITSIKYALPVKFNSANMVINDMNGKTIKQVSLSGSSKGLLQVDAFALPSGTYTYSLVVDGIMINSKQMMISK